MFILRQESDDNDICDTTTYKVSQRDLYPILRERTTRTLEPLPPRPNEGHE